MIAARSPAPRPSGRTNSGRRVPPIDAARVATALLGAISADGDRLDAVLRVVAALVGVPAGAVWRRDPHGRLLLARRFGDATPTAHVAARPAGDTGDADDIADGVPLEAHPTAEPVQLIQVQGQPFAALAIADGLLAVGPLNRLRLSRRDGARLAELARLVEPAMREALRVTALERDVDGLRRELDLARRAVGSTIDADRSLQLLLDLAVGSSGGTGGFVAVRDDDRFTIAVSRDMPAGFVDFDVTPGHGILAEVPGIPGLLIVEDPERLSAAGISGLIAVGGPPDAERSSLVFGLVADDDIALPSNCATLLTTLVTQAALVIESAAASQATADRHVAALRGLCQALDTRSPASDGHHARVAQFARAIAERLGGPAALSELVHDAALVHDVGLLAATATDVLGAEFAHPALGGEMVLLVPGAAHLAPLIRSHHEWWDGFGFPNGLQGEAIPLGGRILATAEFYVEMIESDHAWTAEALADEFRVRRGTQLDPSCADTVIVLIEENS